MIKPTTNKKALCFSVMPQKLQRPQGMPSAANDIPVMLQKPMRLYYMQPTCNPRSVSDRSPLPRRGI